MDIAAPSFLKSALSAIPRRKEGRQAKGAAEIYERELRNWANAILILASELDFQVSARGWCYILEEHGLAKGDFDVAERTITECRKAGYLPLDICAEDTRRMSRGLKDIDDDDCEEYAAGIFRGVDTVHNNYTPFSFWDDKEYYIEMYVEKVDLVSLFEPVCRKFFIPIKNNVGWNDINSRVRTMKRFARHAAKGRKCVLLYGGDFDPSGFLISKSLRDNMKELEGAVNFELAEDEVPDINIDDVIIDRFGLNYDFINANGLSWIPGLGPAQASGSTISLIRTTRKSMCSLTCATIILPQLGRAANALHRWHRRPQVRGQCFGHQAEARSPTMSANHPEIPAPQ